MTTAYFDLAAASRGQPVLRKTSSDETLIQSIAAGDRLAMRTLFARHRVSVYRWLLRLVNDEEVSERHEHGARPDRARMQRLDARDLHRSHRPQFLLVAGLDDAVRDAQRKDERRRGAHRSLLHAALQGPALVRGHRPGAALAWDDPSHLF